MGVGAFLRYARDAFFAKPTPERQLIKLARQHSVRRVVELGIGSLEQTQTLLKAIVDSAGGAGVSYTAVDPFEQREPGQAPLSLIAAHRTLSVCGVKARLTPGDPEHSLATVANSLSDTDLVVLPLGIGERSGSPAWFYLPRMCHPGTLVVEPTPRAEEPDTWTVWPLADVQRQARQAASGWRAAA
ncbi:hypothetical protein [Botrimarina hoheduenensis]|uniref:Uncharacterized protein n=1 Tax=Botrimarina hoheduenensis TaxID=2528000 RepID=A0A5C5WFA8_9BACT|nr:hypothetical protein [Botrimarina hoheduenensis]TWT48801.1 hypothetical protein Pla111_05760 [Botrimarina hoheduenensis]